VPKRVCKAKTKRGTACQAYPLKPGTIIDGVTVKGAHCRKHDPDLSDTARLAGPQPNSGRPRLPRPSEVAQQLIERNVLALQRPYWRALGYDVVIGKDGPELVEIEGGGAKIYGESKDGDINMTMHDDLEAHQKAAERLQDRVYGRPKQATEITSPDGGAIVLVAPPDALDKSRKAAELLKGLGRVDAAD
jgi:hypothetical protein